MAYHDTEWGVPEHDEQKLFEMLILEGAQAGLSWSTILNKRQNYRLVFDGFDPQKIARYNSRRVAKLLSDPGIVRNRLKIAATIGNAKALLELKEQGIEFNDYLWQFVDGQPVINQWKTIRQVPASSIQSDAMAKTLKKAGFKFVGTTICYAFMQAVGMVNDHTVDCFRYKKLAKPKRAGRARWDC
jgi:DNA-3-methyladenine glycosylase I